MSTLCAGPRGFCHRQPEEVSNLLLPGLQDLHSGCNLLLDDPLAIPEPLLAAFRILYGRSSCRYGCGNLKLDVGARKKEGRTYFGPSKAGNFPCLGC